ncbi:diacylglycerol/lipid kinase family protein [Flaviflexus huanghaiensis]|uniref:diacylglycerol/lipid kinase family protein n=1 Tax=Flaviflexus huanghaiensis TaxID=1111473 RepID=UPI0015F84810|nr:diacylglycerol kinase family protein [Flaviflexus huanghaiensis]
MTWDSWLAIAALLVAVSALTISIGNRRALAAQNVKLPDSIMEEVTSDDLRSRPLVVIYNPVKNVNLPAFKLMVEDMAAETGYSDVRWVETTIEHPGDDQARQAVADGAGIVFAAGGDGTVRSVAAGLTGSNVALGIIALGTGNLLARNLDLPISSPEAMVRTALTGGTHPMDIGFLEADPLTEDEIEQIRKRDEVAVSVPGGEHAFAVIAGLGFDAAMVGDADDGLKSKFGWVAYIASAMKNMATTKIRAKVTTGIAHEFVIDARSVMFANVGRLPGGVVLAPEARLDDGWIDLVIIDTKGGLVGWADLVRRMGLAGMGVTHDGLPETGKIDLKKTRAASVVTRDPERVQVDGDALGYASTIRARVEPGGLLVRF